MIKLWEKCEIAKIAAKRGVQNTDTEIIAEELKVRGGLGFRVPVLFKTVQIYTVTLMLHSSLFLLYRN